VLLTAGSLRTVGRGRGARAGGGGLLVAGEPGDVQVVQGQAALVPELVVASAEQDQVVQVGAAAVREMLEVVGVTPCGQRI